MDSLDDKGLRTTCLAGMAALCVLVSASLWALPTVSVDEPVTVSFVGSDEGNTLVEAEKELLLRSPLLLEGVGLVSVLVVPVEKNSNSKIRVKMQPVSLWKDPELSTRISGILDTLLEEAIAIQKLAAQGDSELALAQIAELQKRYPKLGFVLLLKASILMMRGEQQKALVEIKGVLKETPGNKRAQQFYRILSQGDNSSPDQAKEKEKEKENENENAPEEKGAVEP